MNKYKIFVVCMLAATSAVGAYAQSKFDSHSMLAVRHYNDAKWESQAVRVIPAELPFDLKTVSRGGSADAGVIITLNPGYGIDAVEGAGLVVESVIGMDMCVASGSMEDIIALEASQAVKSMSLGAPVKPLLDVAREVTGVKDVHAGTQLPQAYKGTGVVCAIFDNGIDPNHINFYTQDFSGSRVKAVHNFTSSSGGSTGYTTPERIATFTTDSRNATHGTHTLGCMTGAFNLASGTAATGRPVGSYAQYNGTAVITSGARKNPYYGMAPDADIFVCCGQLYNTNIVAAVGKVEDYVKTTGQPAVLNLSIGANNGPHDGTDAVGQALARVGENVIVCISAGNEGEDPISVVKPLTATDKQLKTLIDTQSNAQGFIDVYGSDTNTFDFTLAVVDKTTGEVLMSKKFNTEGSSVLATKNYTVSSYLKDTQFDKAFTSSYVDLAVSNNTSTSGRHSVSFSYVLNPNADTNANRNLVLAVMVEGQAGQRIDITNRVTMGTSRLSSNGLTGWSNGTPDLSINSLACGPNVIVVGSWTSRVKWGTLSKKVYSFTEDANMPLDEVSGFSSYGTLYDGRTLPDICAPGAGIISSFSSYYTGRNTDRDVALYTYNGRDYVWQEDQGTSMASPVCAGTIATWLQADPTLTVEKVRSIIKETAQPLTGGAAVQSSSGKLDGYEGLKKVLNQVSVTDVNVDGEILFAATGLNVYDIFVQGKKASATVYNINGQPMLNAASHDENLQLDLNTLPAGIYLINVNGVRTHRVAVK